MTGNTKPKTPPPGLVPGSVEYLTWAWTGRLPFTAEEEARQRKERSRKAKMRRPTLFRGVKA